MAADLPYMTAVGNVQAILDKMRSAGTPPKFTIEFLKSSLGFTASQDRSFPRILKQLRFLNADGTPLPRYNEFKSSTAGGKAMAAGLREGWAPIFLADQQAYSRSAGEFRRPSKTVTGQGESVAAKMATTFKALATEAGDWSGGVEGDTGSPVDNAVEDADDGLNGEERRAHKRASSRTVSLHHDVHIHLPPTSDVSVYRAIFRALREELM